MCCASDQRGKRYRVSQLKQASRSASNPPRLISTCPSWTSAEESYGQTVCGGYTGDSQPRLCGISLMVLISARECDGDVSKQQTYFRNADFHLSRYEAICRYFRSRQTPPEERSRHHHESLIEEAEQEIKSLSWSELMIAGGVAGVTAWAVRPSL